MNLSSLLKHISFEEFLLKSITQIKITMSLLDLHRKRSSLNSLFSLNIQEFWTEEGESIFKGSCHERRVWHILSQFTAWCSPNPLSLWPLFFNVIIIFVYFFLQKKTIINKQKNYHIIPIIQIEGIKNNYLFDFLEVQSNLSNLAFSCLDPIHPD